MPGMCQLDALLRNLQQLLLVQHSHWRIHHTCSLLVQITGQRCCLCSSISVVSACTKQQLQQLLLLLTVHLKLCHSMHASASDIPARLSQQLSPCPANFLHTFLQTPANVLQARTRAGCGRGCWTRSPRPSCRPPPTPSRTQPSSSHTRRGATAASSMADMATPQHVLLKRRSWRLREQRTACCRAAACAAPPQCCWRWCRRAGTS